MLVLIALAASRAWAQCDPSKMVRVVYRDVSPGVDAQSAAAQPETLYRLGTRYARVEGALDLHQGVQPLMVASEPDVWMVNLLSHHGRHVIDTDASSGFHAPVAGDPDIPPAVAAMEFGCEVAFMKAGGAPKKAELDGQRVSQYERRIDAYRLVLSVAQQRGVPVAFSLYEKDKLVFALRYLEYDASLSPKMELFQRPEGIAYDEAK
jgi:hypothetical protein